MSIDTLIPLAWILLSLAVAGVIFATWSDLKGAPFVTTPQRTIRKMLALAQVGPDDVVYDLGSGDGRILFTVAQEYGAKAIGIEIDPLRYLWTRWQIRRKGLIGQVEVIRQDMFTVDLSPASVVTCYLLSETNLNLMGKLETELFSGTRIVSRNFPFPGWPLIAEEPGEKGETIYCYKLDATRE